MTDKHTGTLRATSLKVTPARLALLAFMHDMKKPVDVAEIISKLTKLGIVVNQSTVYRILSTFIEHNLIQQVQLQEGKSRYELASLPHHHHAICISCGHIEDIDSCDISITPSALKKSTILIHSHSLEFFGLCANCRK